MTLNIPALQDKKRREQEFRRQALKHRKAILEMLREDN